MTPSRATRIMAPGARAVSMSARTTESMALSPAVCAATVWPNRGSARRTINMLIAFLKMLLGFVQAVGDQLDGLVHRVDPGAEGEDGGANDKFPFNKR